MTTGQILGEKYIENGLVADVVDFTPDLSVSMYYEVVRLIDGKFLFLKDHFKRLEQTLSRSGLHFPGPEMIIEHLCLLLRNNDFTIGNIRICIQPGGGDQYRLTCYFVPYFYPEICMYKSGVHLVSYSHVRPNPGIKKWDDQFRRGVKEAIRDHGVYEVVLLNEKKQITEGSRSNIFFIDRNDLLITPPLSDVLPGITRKYVLEICASEKMKVVERPVQLSEMDKMISCFITGTSPKVLPVWQLDGFQFKVDHPKLELIMIRFDQLIDKHLEKLDIKSC
jgi:branched-chain amino acid aminotransferase